MLELPCFILHSIFSCKPTQKFKKDSMLLESTQFLEPFFSIINCHLEIVNFIIHRI